MNKNLKALNGYCLVAFPVSKESTDTAGLIVPGQDDDNNGILTIVSDTCGSDLSESIGKTVYFTKFQQVRIDGAKFMLVEAADIYLVKD